MGFPGGSAVKNLLVMQVMWVQSLGREDPLEEGMTAHSNILAWRTSGPEEPGGCSPRGPKEVDTTELLSLHVETREYILLFPWKIFMGTGVEIYGNQFVQTY